MKSTFRSFGVYLWLTLIAGLVAIVAAPADAENCSSTDATGPTVFITAPTSDSAYETAQSTITLSGDVLEDCGLKMVDWSVDQSEGIVSDIASGETDDWAGWSWRTGDITLEKGLNRIVVTAEDAAGNLGEAIIDVTYTPPVQPPLPPVGETAALDIKKVKFTFYFGGSYYEDLDRFSIVGYLQKEADEEFLMPFDQDVTAIIHVPGVEEPIFSQTVPAGTISGTRKYRYTGTPGIRDLTLMQASSTTVYVYLFVYKWNFLPLIKANLTPEAYQTYVQNIGSFTFTLLIGPESAWQGSAPLHPRSYNAHKQEMTYNR